MAETDRERIIRLEMIVEHQSQTLEKMAIKVDKMHDILSQGKGGWKVILAVASISTFLTTTLIKIFPIISSLPR